MILNLPYSLKKYRHRKDFPRARIESSFQWEDSRGSISAMEVRRSRGWFFLFLFALSCPLPSSLPLRQLEPAFRRPSRQMKPSDCF